MYSSSIAFLLTNDKSWSAHMHDLLLQAGFKESRMFPRNPAALTKHRNGPLPFVFIHSSVGPAYAQRAFTFIRAHTDASVRFLPIVVLTETRDAATILKFIELGCDDIITMPLTAAALMERLKRQVGHPLDYFQTDTYFGPDRRQHEATRDSTNEARGKGDHFFRHFSIQRHLQHGVTIIDTDVHYPAESTWVLT